MTAFVQMPVGHLTAVAVLGRTLSLNWSLAYCCCCCLSPEPEAPKAPGANSLHAEVIWLMQLRFFKSI